MKKFGKILGISALTVAAMAVGTLGLLLVERRKRLNQQTQALLSL